MKSLCSLLKFPFFIVPRKLKALHAENETEGCPFDRAVMCDTCGLTSEDRDSALGDLADSTAMYGSIGASL
jgi:aminoglycoside phosphotransferase